MTGCLHNKCSCIQTNHKCNTIVSTVGMMATIAQVVLHIVSKKIVPAAVVAFSNGHNVKIFSEWIWATNMGMYACSETSLRTVVM